MIQPFVENAIIHGLKKKEGKGFIAITFKIEGNLIICTIDDNGIGRKKSGAINGETRPNHKSTGIAVTQKRLEQYGLHRKVMSGIKIVDLEENGSPVGTRVIIATPFEGELART
jgi:sensor histidine kinase YesM